MKYILKSVALFCLFAVFLGAVTVKAHSGGCWFVKRNGNERPGFPADAEDVKRHSGYFIDENLTEDEKRLYLTFDAGYDNGNLAGILDVLKEEGVPAAFFVLDNLIVKNTDLVLRMADEGHLVCNHTKRHKDLTGANDDEIKKDLSALEELYKERTGREMAKYFRFPEGKYSLSALKAVERLGYKTVFWSFAYFDWDNKKQPDPNWAKRKILDNTHNGAVILLHPNSSTNRAILKDLIAAWRAEGYSFGTLDELTGK